MDSNDQEKERGITIWRKYHSRGTTSTSTCGLAGHADFGGEVERVHKVVTQYYCR